MNLYAINNGWTLETFERVIWTAEYLRPILIITFLTHAYIRLQLII